MRLAFFAVSAVLLLSLVGAHGRTARRPTLGRSRRGGRAERPYMATRARATRDARSAWIGCGRIHSAPASLTRPTLAPRVAVWDARDARRASSGATRRRRRRLVRHGRRRRHGCPRFSSSAVRSRRAATAASLGASPRTTRDRGGRARAAGAHRRPGGDSATRRRSTSPSCSTRRPATRMHLGFAAAHRRRGDGQHAVARSRTRGRSRTSGCSSAICRRPADDRAPSRRARPRRGARARSSCRGSEILPVVADDSLYWALELYVASDDYPLAERVQRPRRAARLLPARRHGARACGERARASRARCRRPRPSRRAGRTDFPSLFVRVHGALAAPAGGAAARSRRRAGAGARLRVGGLSRRQPRGAPLRGARRGGLRRVARADARRASEPRRGDVVDAARCAGSRARRRRRRGRCRTRDERGFRSRPTASAGEARWIGCAPRTPRRATRPVVHAPRARRSRRWTAAVLAAGVPRARPARARRSAASRP